MSKRIAQDAAQYIAEAMSRLDYGEVAVTVRLHEGRNPIVEYHESRKVKTTEPHYAGMTGGHNDRRTDH
jgi:hypothetical protein